MAVPGRPDADALPAIVAGSPLPVIADIHFNASLALRAIDAGVAAVRINPGNIGGPDRVEQVVTAARAAGIPMRIGANSGSLPDHLRQFATNDPAGALVEAALEEVRLLERLEFRDFKISVKSSSVPVMIQAYRRLSEQVPYPLHLGVTEAGPAFTGTVKSAIGIGSLLADGIGDTLRVSLTADPVEEVKVAWEILRVLGLRHKGPVMIACPSCGRTNVDVLELAEAVERRLAGYDQVFHVAVMGCAVNGPGEAGDADFGIAGGRDAGHIYAHGEVLRRVPQAALVDELFSEIDAWIAAGMVRPERPIRRLRAPGGCERGLGRQVFVGEVELVAERCEAGVLRQVGLELRHPERDPVAHEALVDRGLACGDVVLVHTPVVARFGVAIRPLSEVFRPSSRVHCGSDHEQAQGSHRVCHLCRCGTRCAHDRRPAPCPAFDADADERRHAAPPQAASARRRRRCGRRRCRGDRAPPPQRLARSRLTVLRHVVLFRWNDGTEPAHVDRVEAELRAMLDRLDMVRAWTLGRDAGLREGNADMALVVDMDDADAFRRYSADAGHQQILNELILPACTRTGVQFVID